MHAAISSLFPRHRGQADLEGLNCEVNLSQEKGQTYNRREHGRNKEATAYIGLPVPDRLRNNPHIYAEEVFATADYNERFGDVVRTIVDRGVGEGVFLALAKEFTARLDGPRPDWLSDRALIYGVYEYACASGLSKEKRQIEKAFAESADGDAVAAHIAFGNDYLCTEDRGRSALSPSIFDAENRAADFARAEQLDANQGMSSYAADLAQVQKNNPDEALRRVRLQLKVSV